MNDKISDELMSKVSEFIVDEIILTKNEISLTETDDGSRIVIIKQYFEDQWCIDIGEYILSPDSHLVFYKDAGTKCAYENYNLELDDGLAFDNPEEAYQFYKKWRCK